MLLPNVRGMNLKRLGLGLLALLVLLLGAGGGAWWWLHRAKPDAASYLPENTFLFVHIPDAQATSQAYATSHLKKVIASQEISSLLTLGWQSLAEKTSAEDKAKATTALELWQLFARNLTGEAFLAITQVDFQNPGRNRFVAAIRPRQGLGDMPPLVARIKQLTAESMKSAPSGKATHGGVEYEWIDLEGKAKLCLAPVGPWEVVAIGEEAFFDFVDRWQDGGKKSGTLAQNAAYQAVLARMPGRQDALVYVGMDAIKDPLIKLAEARPEWKQSAPALKKLQEQIKGVGWGGKFEDGRIHETFVSLMPKASRPDLGKSYEPCAYKTLSMTGAQTYFYFAQSFDLPKQWDYMLALYKETNPDVATLMQQAPDWAKGQGLDFNKNLLQALGSEYAMLMDWPSGALFPDVAFVCEVARPDDLKPTIAVLMQNLTPLLEQSGTIEDAKAGNYDLKVLRIKQAAMISPTLIVSGDRFGLSLTQAGATAMLTRAADATLAKQEAFKSVGGGNNAGTISMAYFNFGGFVNQTYQTAKPYAGMAAMLSPEMGKLLGSGKLPDTLSFTGDLGSWLMLTRVDDESARVSSVSNIGNAPLVVAGFAGLTAAVAGQQMKPGPHNSPVTYSAPGSGEATAENVKAELEELRAVVEAYSVAKDVPKGTAVTWSAISSYLVPDSSLLKRGGKDALGNLYVLGVIGESPADVAPETKAKFPDRDAAFWSTVTPAAQ